jgi:hypothetical protein
MTFKFCELSAAIGYATCYYENHEDCDLSEALVVGIQEFASPYLDEATMDTLMSHLDIATKEYQADRELDENEDDEDEDEYEDEDEDEE